MPNSQREFRLNQRCAKLGGVCAGLADYFNFPVWVVRVGFIAAGIMIGWPIAIFAYIVACCCFSEGNSFSAPLQGIMNFPVIRHFKAVDYSKPLQKSSRGKILGVCKGIADYLEVKPWIIRLIALLSLFSSGPLAVVLYFVAAIVMDRDHGGYDATQRYFRATKSYYYDSRQSRKERWARRAERRKASREHKRSRQSREAYRQAENSNFDESEELAFGNTADNRDRDDQKKRIFDYRRTFNDTIRKFTEIEKKLQCLEATITSKKFQLHCDFKKISQ